jgi:tetratricopeptide (TPR) repeat protein
MESHAILRGMTARRFAVAALLLTWCGLGAAQDQAGEKGGPLEITSLLGRNLYGLPDQDGAIEAAQKKIAADPKNVALVLQLSKAQAAKRQYREAIATCTAGLVFAPRSAELYLERGHRELGLRQFSGALADLQKAVQIDPKQLDEYYHLGLAHYFLRQFGPAADAFRNALNLAQTSDSVIDCSNWLYVSLRRAGQNQAAAQVLTRITPEVKNTEPHLLFYLRLLRFYQGEIPEARILPPKPANASDIEGELAFDTTSYGVGNWHLYNSEPKRASELFKSVVTGYAWNSWGFIGSEVELAKGGGE